MYGFGSPRVGNIPFAEKFDELVFNAWRISNLNDIVTKWVPKPKGSQECFSDIAACVTVSTSARAVMSSVDKGLCLPVT